MEALFNSWSSFLKPDTAIRRVVLNELKIITESDFHNFPLPREELEKIKRWAGLQGEPSFLGSGTMGNAYQFGDRVLKLTSDYDEALAASAISGKRHPNVYNIHGVARRFDPKDRSSMAKPHWSYAIVYDLVGEVGGIELPNKEQQDVILSIHASTDQIWYNWDHDAFELFERFVQWAQQNPEIVEAQPATRRYNSYKEKFELLMDYAGFDAGEKKILSNTWRLAVGMTSYKYDLRSAEEIRDVYEHNKTKIKAINDISKGLTFLSKNGIIYKDLKTTNVMQDDGDLVIIDIGKSAVSGYHPVETI